MNSAVTSSPLGAPRWAERLWRALEASGRARAQHHLRDFADQCEASQPELAKALRAACRAAQAA